MSTKVYVRPECGSEDRIGENLGPFDFVQMNRDILEGWTIGEENGDTIVELFWYEDGWWYPYKDVDISMPKKRWSDLVFFSDGE